MKTWYKEQYNFRKEISKYWINPELVTSEKESKKSKFGFEIPYPSTLSTTPFLSPGTSTCNKIVTDCSSKKRASRVDNASLEPIGILSLRLNRSVDQIIDKDKINPGVHYIIGMQESYMRAKSWLVLAAIYACALSVVEYPTEYRHILQLRRATIWPSYMIPASQ